MSQERIIIKDTKENALLADGIESQQVQFFEGAWYFDRESVDMTHLHITDRTYNCPYKGVCYWIDLQMPNHREENVGFTYFKVHPGYEFIKDKIGFYSGRRKATYEEAVVLS